MELEHYLCMFLALAGISSSAWASDNIFFSNIHLAESEFSSSPDRKDVTMIILMLFIPSGAMKMWKQLFHRLLFLPPDQNQPSQLGINARAWKHRRQTASDKVSKGDFSTNGRSLAKLLTREYRALSWKMAGTRTQRYRCLACLRWVFYVTE